MSNYQLDTSRHAACWTKGRGGHGVQYIVIHHWDDPKKHPTFEGTVSWFVSGKGRTSAHYVVEAGRVARMVAESDTAWHAGNWNYNQRSIGIECNPRASEADKQTVAQLVTELLARYPGAKLIGHKDIVATGCPGAYYPPAKALAPYLGGNPTSAPAPAPTAPAGVDVERLAREVIDGKHGNGEARKKALGANYGAVQARVNEILAGNKAPAKKKTTDQVAREVIQGQWGNGADRKKRLTQAGYNYNTIQRRVNQLLK